jgi:hypothetical protein
VRNYKECDGYIRGMKRGKRAQLVRKITGHCALSVFFWVRVPRCLFMLV